MKKNLRLLGAGALLRLMAGILAACAGDCSAKEQPAVQTVNTNNVRWGEITNGLQMGIVVEPAFGVVHCWLRNGETNEIAYNDWSLAYWEEITLHVREGTNWVGLGRAPRGMGPYEGIGPSIGKVIRLNPGDVIAPRPASREATFVVDLRDFEWPTNVLRQHECEIRVCHYFAACQESGSFAPGDAKYARGSAGFTVFSPVFILKGSEVQSLLDQLPDGKGR